MNVVFDRKTVRDLPLEGHTVLMRADYNVPLDDEGKIADDFRIQASLDTIRYLLARRCKVVIISHLGRPNGQVDEKFSLRPVQERLNELLDVTVKFADDCIGDKAKVASKSLVKGQVLLLENLRFHAEEEKNDAKFARSLAKDSGAKFFVQDGFGVVHRAHASTSAITEFLPSVAGLLLEKEWLSIKGATDNPNRPLVALLGGAKISDKIELIERFIDIADRIVVGGAMANNFLEYLKYPIGSSVYEPGIDTTIARILKKARAKYSQSFSESFLIPVDVAVAKNGRTNDPRVEIDCDEVTKDNKIFDIGPKTIKRATDMIVSAGTVIWNGTLGLAEQPAFAYGSARVAMALAKNPQITSVIGGGDTADFVRNWDVLKGGSFTHVSTGGGASLELMAGEVLPGIAALLPA